MVPFSKTKYFINYVIFYNIDCMFKDWYYSGRMMLLHESVILL